MLVAALGVSLTPVEDAVSDGSCEKVELREGVPTMLPLAASATDLRGEKDATVDVAVGRFTPESPQPLGVLTQGETARLDIPADEAGIPWNLILSGTGSVTLCTD